MKESRTKKTLLNAKVNLGFYLLVLVVSFFSRKVFLENLGTDFIGLTGTLYNLLSFLNLAELGIGTSIGYLLFKPIFENDREKISQIISVMAYLYRVIGLIILCSGVILSCFLPLIFPVKSTGIGLPLIYFAYYVFLFSSLLGYFANYKQNLLTAAQREYVITAIYQAVNLIKALIQIYVAYKYKNPLYWIFIELCMSIIYSYLLNKKISKTYPWLTATALKGKKLRKDYPEVMQKTKQLFVHQINSFAQFQTTPLLTYAFVSLSTVALLGNYTLIFDKITGLMNSVLGSSSAGVGNLIAEGNKNSILRNFWKLTLIRSICACVIFFACFIGTSPFISSWLGTKYVLSQVILVLILLKIYVQVSTGATGQFIFGYGLFGDIWASILQTVIFLTGAILLGMKYELAGILSAAILSILLIPGIWKSYYLFSRGFKINYSRYCIKKFLITILNTGIISGGILCFQVLNIELSRNLFLLLGEIAGISLVFATIVVLIYRLIFSEIRELGSILSIRSKNEI